MKQQNNTTRDRAMNNINSMLNQHHISHNHSPSSSDFDPTSSHDGFLEQMLSSAAAGTFPWSDDHAPPHLDDQMGLHQISNKELMLQHHQQLLLSNGILPDHNVDASLFKSANQDNDAAVKALFNGFTGSLNQATNQSQNFHNSQAQEFGAPAAPSASGAGKQKPRVRARRGQATDPHSIAERLRRERIADRMKALQELVPNPNKTDKASMLDEIIDYVKFLQLQVKVLSMSRLGGAGAAAAAANPVANNSPEGRRSSTQTVPSSNNNEGMSVSENQVVKMMEEDMGSAMQYLQGKGLCLMPISLATAISTSTCHTRINPLARTNTLNINGNGEDGGPSSPNMSVLTAQSAAMGGSGGVEVSVKDATSVLKMDSSS